METLFRFFVQHPLLPIAILLVSVLAGLLFLPRKRSHHTTLSPWQQAIQNLRAAEEEAESEEKQTIRYADGVRDYLEISKVSLERAVQEGLVPEGGDLAIIRAGHEALRAMLRRWEIEAEAFRKANPYPRP